MLIYPLWFLLSTNFFIKVEDCIYHGRCTGTEWVLKYQGHTVEGLPDGMSEQECRDILSQLEGQTEAFTEPECVEVGISRQAL